MKDYTYYVIGEKNETTGKEVYRAEKIANVYKNLLDIKPQQDFKIVSIVAMNTLKSAKEATHFMNGRREIVQNGRITYNA
jgi:hypothetical protein